MSCRFTGAIVACLLVLFCLPANPALSDQASVKPGMPDGGSGPLAGFDVPDRQGLPFLFGSTEIAVRIDPQGRYAGVLERLAGAGRTETPEREDFSGAVSTGRRLSPDRRASLARVDQARAQSRQALALLLPSVSLRANRGMENSKPSVAVDPLTGDLLPESDHIRTDVSLTVRQPLFDLPGFLDWRRRQRRVDARRESYRASDGDAFLATTDAYLRLVSSRLKAEITFDYELRLAHLLDYIEKRTEAGASTVADMARVRARRQVALSLRLEQDAIHAAAGIAFLRRTRLAPEKVVIPLPEDVGADLLPDSFEAAVPLALDNNPEIRAIGAELNAARVDRNQARGRFLPRVDLEYTDSFSEHAGGAESDKGQRDRRLMVVANWELVSGGGDIHRLAERRARIEELLYRLEDERLRVLEELAAGYSDLLTIRSRLDTGYQELRSVSTAARAMTSRMLSGNQSLLDLLDVLTQLHQARLRLVDLHVEELRTVADLVRLVFGTPEVPGSENSKATMEQSDSKGAHHG
ncbi:MAG: hypothetical protein D6751_08835 [Deltaproteobacteria bacterium]|nr:MAG: hypothetical protein D6751_08835 [Deltaproteobacteria bacterium]